MNNINTTMTWDAYSALITNYIKKNYGNRGIQIYTEINLGKTVIGKQRRVDIFIVNEIISKALAIECKFQDVSGTVDEKIPYALEDISKIPISAVIVYAGNGFSKGILHMLEASPFAAYCLPQETLEKSSKTKELDHFLAMCFSWWDILIQNKTPI